MEHALKFTLALTVLWTGLGSVTAAIPERYQSIIDRNAFELNPPPVELPPPPVAPPPPAKIDLTGFAEIAGQKMAYFAMPPKDPREGSRYFSLSEGQRDGTVELVQIRDAAGEVVIRNNGQESVLNFTNRVAKGALPPPSAGMNAPVPTRSTPVIFNPDAGRRLPPPPPPMPGGEITPAPEGQPPSPSSQLRPIPFRAGRT